MERTIKCGDIKQRLREYVGTLGGRFLIKVNTELAISIGLQKKD